MVADTISLHKHSTSKRPFSTNDSCMQLQNQDIPKVRSEPMLESGNSNANRNPRGARRANDGRCEQARSRPRQSASQTATQAGQATRATEGHTASTLFDFVWCSLTLCLGACLGDQHNAIYSTIPAPPCQSDVAVRFTKIVTGSLPTSVHFSRGAQAASDKWESAILDTHFGGNTP